MPEIVNSIAKNINITKKIAINPVVKNVTICLNLSGNLFFMKLNEKCALTLKPYAALNIPNHISRKRHDSSDHEREVCRTYLKITWEKLIITNDTSIIQSKDSKGL